MEQEEQIEKPNKVLSMAGWIISSLGYALYLYGYFMEGGPSWVAWAEHAPGWIAEFLPNWQAELGMILSCIGFVPLLYVEIQKFKQEPAT